MVRISDLGTDITVSIFQFLGVGDVMQLMTVNQYFSILSKSNVIWRQLYQRSFPSYIIGPESVHHNSSSEGCQGEVCSIVKHYSNLRKVYVASRKYANFRQQFVKRMMAIDKRMVRNYIGMCPDMISKKIQLIDKQMRVRHKQIEQMSEQRERLIRAKRIKLTGFDNMYAYCKTKDDGDLDLIMN